MATIRKVLFLATVLTIGWYFFKPTDLLALDTGFFMYTAPIDKGSTEGNQYRLEEEMNETGRYDHTLVWMKNDHRVVENLSGPVAMFCIRAKFVRELVKTRKYLPKFDPIRDSGLIRMMEEVVDVCERTLKLCGLCPGPVYNTPKSIRTSQNQARSHSSQQVELQMPIKIIIRAFGAIFAMCVGADLFARPIFYTMSALRLLTYMVLDFVACTLIYVSLSFLPPIHLIVRMFVDTGFFSLVFRHLLTLVISVTVMRFLRNRLFKVEYSVVQTLVEHDQLLIKVIQRTVVIRLAAGASRLQLLPYEEYAGIILERIKNVKLTYESNLFFKFVCGGFISKGEEIVDICERIFYLCRPAIAA